MPPRSIPNPAESVSRAPSEPEPRDARRRQELIAATIECIAEHGLSGTTVARVARRAGLSTGIVNFYFQGKDALLLQTLEYVDSQYMLRQREAVLAHGSSPVACLEAMIDAAFDPELCHPHRVAVWAAFWGEARAREDYMRICAAREDELEEQRVQAFAAIAAEGGYTHLEPEALGRAFHHMVSSLPESLLGDRGSFDLEKARGMCRGFLSSIFPAEFSGCAAAFRSGYGSPQGSEAPGIRDPSHLGLPRPGIFRTREGEHLSAQLADGGPFEPLGRTGRLRHCGSCG